MHCPYECPRCGYSTKFKGNIEAHYHTKQSYYADNNYFDEDMATL